MNPDRNQPWWNTEMFGDTEPPVVYSKWAAAQSPRVVLLPGRPPVEDVT